MLQFTNVPYTKVFQLRFTKNDLHTIEYKLSHEDRRQAFIGKRKQFSRTTSAMHPVKAMENIPEPEIKILSSRKQKSDKQLSQAKKMT